MFIAQTGTPLHWLVTGALYQGSLVAGRPSFWGSPHDEAECSSRLLCK